MKRPALSLCLRHFCSLRPWNLTILLAGLPACLIAAPLNVSSSTDLPEDTVATYDNIAVSGGATLTIGGGSAITVTGAVTVSGNSFIVFAGKNVDAKIDDEWQGVGSSLSAASVTVDAGSAIHADGQGYPSVPLSSFNMGTGPGGYASTTAIAGNYSASHGGRGTGTAPASDPIGPVYGSMLQPTTLGSSSFGYLSPMQGGGAIRLSVSGALTVNGRISADGTVQGTNHSGATGGSVWITTGSLAGSGTIQANASPKGVASTNRGSAGGRVAVYYTNAAGFPDLSKITATSGSDLDESEDGTVWLERNTDGERHLTVVGRVDLEGFESEELDTITVEDGGSLEIPGGTDLVVASSVVVKDGGVIRAEGKNNTARVDGSWQGEGIHLTVPTLTIEAGGVFHADGQGYQSDGTNVFHILGTGPGGSAVSTYSASHGGSAASNTVTVPPPLSYGSLREPTDLGSSAYGYLSRTDGGGAIRLSISDTVTIDGILSANGLAEGTNHNGAAGGSIWITTDTLAGSGSIQANASGKGTVPTNRYSGGGRIAITYSDASGFDDLAAIEAKSGGTDDASEDGTVFLLDVDNGAGDLTIAGRVGIQEDVFETLQSVTILDSGQLELFGGSTLQVAGPVDVAAGGEIVFRSKGLKKSFRDEWVGEGSHLLARTLSVPSGASITADGQGYLQGPGSELRQFVNVAASHGGLGSGPVQAVYGSGTRPLTPGSGGGAGVVGYTAGGGALQITASESILLNGSISANGVSQGTSQSGATGGSIWITTPSLTGSGTIHANAAPSGTVAANNDSGGGRVAVYTSDALGIPSGNIEAAGEGDAEDGTVVVVDDGAMFWLEDLPFVLHGNRQVSWYAGALASGQSVRLVVRQGGTDTSVLTSDDPVGFGTADLSSLSTGLYGLHLQVVGAGDSVVRELVSNHSINNDLIWHSGTVVGDEVWAAGAIHVIEDDLLIGKGSSVTVAEGAIVKVWPRVGVTLSADGSFVTEGTSQSPTILTSWLDDNVGGDTNGDADATSAAIGDWDGFQLDFNSVLQLATHSEVRYSRQTWQGKLDRTTHLLKGLVHQVTGDLSIAPWTKLVIGEGAVVKLAEDADIVFDLNTALESSGTPARPVVITSILDDRFGGDTNGDGDATSAAPGDWGRIETNIGVNLVDNTHILFGGNTNTLGAIGNASGSGSILTIRDSVVADAFFDAITTRFGVIRVENTIISGADRGVFRASGADLQLVNCTIDDNRIGVAQHAGGELQIRNSIISNSLEYGIFHDGGSASDIIVSHTLFWNPDATGGDVFSVYSGALGTFSFTVTSDGNLNQDPLFASLDPLLGLSLSAGSPAIDAADGTLAPEHDKLGRARRDEPSAPDTGIALNGVIADMGAYEFYENAPTEIDIKALNLSGPESAMTGESVTLGWTVANIGLPLQNVVWKSRIYLVAAGGADSDRILVGERITDISGLLNTGDEHIEEVEFVVPVVPEGGYLWVVDVNVGNTPFEGPNRSNNLITSGNAAHISIPELSVEEVLAGEFGGDQTRFAFKFRAPEGKDWLIVLDAEGVNGRTRLYANRGFLADPMVASESGLSGEPDSLINLAGPNAETWYILGVAETNPDGVLPFTIGVTEVNFELMGIHPASGSLPGPVTISLEGTGLRATAEVVLSDGSGPERVAIDTVFNSGRLSATFDLDGLAPGAFDVVVRQDENEDMLEDAFQLGSGNPGRLMSRFLLPEAVRAGRLYKAWLEYENVGGTDLVAPVIGIYGTGGVKLGLTRDEEEVTLDSLSLAAISDTETPWILPPGAKGRIAVVFRAVSGRNVLESTTTTTTSTDVMNWSEVGAVIRPDDPPDGWDDMWSFLVDDYGPTAGDYVRLVGDAIEKYHTQQGIVSPSMLEPLRYYVFEMIGEVTSDLTGRVLLGEAGTPAAGVVVSFTYTVGGAVSAATTMRDGTFRTNLPASGDYDVYVDGLLVADDSTQISWDGKDSLRDVELHASTGGVMEGTVGLADGLGDEDWVVFALHVESGDVFAGQVSDLGRYRLTGLPEGDFEVSAVATGYVSDGPKIATIAVGTPGAGPDFIIRPGGSLSGLVVDSDETPLEGVSVITVGGEATGGALTDESGAYQIAGLPGGDYIVSFLLNGFKSEEVSGVTVKVDEELILEDVVLARAGTINGLILSGGLPVPGVVVSAESGGDRLFDRVSDGDGRFTFTNAYPGSWTVTADSIEYELESDTVSVIDSDTPAVIELDLEKSIVLRGEVDRVGTDDPATGILVILANEAGDVLGDISDLDGGFLFGRLEPGDYTVSLADGSHRQTVTVLTGVQPDSVTMAIETGALKGTVQFPADIDELPFVQLRQDGDVVLTQVLPADGQFGWEDLAPGEYSLTITQADHTFTGSPGLEVVANETTDIGEIAIGTGRLMVSVIDDATGNPIGGGIVMATDSLGVERFFDLESDGSVEIEGLVDGTYWLEAIHSLGVSQKTPISFDSGLTAVVLRTMPTGSIGGSVLDSGGDPFELIEVSAYLEGSNAPATEFWTDGNGDYGVPILLPGTYTVVFAARFDDANDSLISPKIVAGVTVVANSVTTLDAVLAADTLGISGSVSTSDGGHPVSGSIVLEDQAGRFLARSSLDPDGNYRLPRPDPGTYTVHAEANSFAVEDVEVVVSGSPVVLDLEASWVGGRAIIEDAGVLGASDPRTSADQAAVPAWLKGQQIANSMIEWVREMMAEPPEKRSSYSRPGAFRVLECPCPEAQAIWGKVQRMQMQADQLWDNWHEQWEGGLEAALADVGLFGVELGKFAIATSKVLEAADLMKDIGGDIAKFESWAASGVTLANVSFDELKIVTQQMELAGKQMSALWGSRNTIKKGVSVSSGLPGLYDKIMNPATFSTKAGFLSAMGSITSLVKDVKGIFDVGIGTVSVINALAGKFPDPDKVPFLGKVWDKFGKILDILGPLQAAGEAVTSAGRAITAYQNKEYAYDNALKRLDKVYETLGPVLAKCLAERCCRPPKDCCKEEGKKCDPPPPPPGKKNRPPGTTGGVESNDPNDKSTIGVGAEGYIAPDSIIVFTIRFENVATATAPAQLVVITDVLDADLDWSTLELLEIGFNGTIIEVPPGLSQFNGTSEVESDPYPVAVSFLFDNESGTAQWSMQSFDPETGDYPEDALAGFLPPNDETGRGEGFVTFLIEPKSGLIDGSEILNSAEIVFDVNDPIVTNETVNTIDSKAPTASAGSLSERSGQDFIVTWLGDDAGGAGVSFYDVYVSVDGGEWTLWLEGTAETSADYEGTPGSTYAFYVHATDALGFANPVVPTAQAQTIAGVSFLVNISNRGGVGTGPNIMIPGFVIDGSGTKKVLVRAVGPTLGGFGVQGTLEDPQLTVVSGGADIAVNDNWSDAPEAVQIAEVAARVGAFPLEAESGDAAALLDLEAGSYTVKVSGVAQGTGVALVELYDTDEAANPSSKLVNISNRGEVGVGSAIMIPGFVVGGETPKTVLIRGVGPKLGDFGVQGVLEDPTLGVFRSGEADALHTNDNWGDAANAGELSAATASVGAFALEAGSKDAAVLVTLEPGAYTVKVSGVNGTEGVALVEIYEVE